MFNLHKNMNSRGYTLVELLIYSVVALIVIGFSLSLVRSTSSSYTRDRRKSRMQTEGRNSILMMAREIVNTGFKKYLHDNGDGTFTLTPIGNTTTGDLTTPEPVPGAGESSFLYTHASPGDMLEIFKGTLNSAGQHDKTQRISYSLSGNTLIRTLKEHDGANWVDQGTIELANNVEALQFQFSKNKVAWTIDFTGTPKEEIQAIKIFVLMRTNKEVDMNVQETYSLGNITLTPTGDKYLRRLYEETVEVVNNGT